MISWTDTLPNRSIKSQFLDLTWILWPTRLCCVHALPHWDGMEHCHQHWLVWSSPGMCSWCWRISIIGTTSSACPSRITQHLGLKLRFGCRATVLNWQPSSITEFFQTSSVNGSPVAERVQPLLVGKISTFVQFALVGACVFSGAVGEPVTNAYTNLLIANTYIWTAGSGVAYLITCPWLKGSDKAFMLVSGLTACSLYHMWPA